MVLPPRAWAAVSLLLLLVISEVGTDKGKIYCCHASYLLCFQCWLALWEVPGGIWPSQALWEEKCSAAYPREGFGEDFSGVQTCTELLCVGRGASLFFPPCRWKWKLSLH